MIGLKSGIAAFVALAAFAPVFCLTEITEAVGGAFETTRCNGLLPIPSNVWLMIGMSVGTFGLTFWWLRRRRLRR